MKFQEKTCFLKSGNSIKIRVAKVADAQNLLDLKRSYIKNTTSIPLQLVEYPNDLNKELSIIEQYLSSSNSILLIAEFDNEAIGNIDLTGNVRSKLSHTAMIGMGIKEEWRNQGLGRALIESVLDWAKNHSELKLIWLDVYASNELGYNLYKNTGFIVSGIIKDFFKEEHGYNDKVQMYQRIK